MLYDGHVCVVCFFGLSVRAVVSLTIYEYVERNRSFDTISFVPKMEKSSL